LENTLGATVEQMLKTEGIWVEKYRNL